MHAVLSTLEIPGVDALKSHGNSRGTPKRMMVVQNLGYSRGGRHLGLNSRGGDSILPENSKGWQFGLNSRCRNIILPGNCRGNEFWVNFAWNFQGGGNFWLNSRGSHIILTKNSKSDKNDILG